uniref:Nucleotide-diphospho-sugar transferase domain-containing protein n=1 Tax=Chromera velia CCMP2878 TaxID=1169474 RepID=A0A0G4I2Y8_9ALVE|eukprot:Cvel_10537.t1-p1 / transcript=Cvel_10537.t1 / gene=Cvel_10537 / organism=Chromera_velia_CCMP2878 / gene_product=hypothetical protein / transcript_product=hypothetical protein / location=Cvel_scaffold638:6660-13495(-) / protein_length=582 / sequence_SO=supercontig / SO=protein_coding / is_pseudo=false
MRMVFRCFESSWLATLFACLCFSFMPRALTIHIEETETGRRGCHSEFWVLARSGLDAGEKLLQEGRLDEAQDTILSLLSVAAVDPVASFSCGLGVSALFFLLANICFHAGLGLRALQAVQLSIVFAARELQSKSVEDLQNDPIFPTHLRQLVASVEQLKPSVERKLETGEPWRKLPARVAVSSESSSDSAHREKEGEPSIAIVTVCDYDSSKTSLGTFSKNNRETYLHVREAAGGKASVSSSSSSRRGQTESLVFYEMSPQLPLEAPEGQILHSSSEAYDLRRPLAWGKIDGLVSAIGEGRFDWVVWVDCDTFFLDPEIGFGDLIGFAFSQKGSKSQMRVGEEEREKVRGMYRDYLKGTPESECRGVRETGSDCGVLGLPEDLWRETGPQALISEDGLMVNTGVFAMRAGLWSLRFLLRVHAASLKGQPLVMHPWWEQAAMTLLLTLPQAVKRGGGQEKSDYSAATNWGYPPAVFLFSQRQMNPYPHLIASQMGTHVAAERGDFVISFSGCKTYTSPEVCEELFRSHFARGQRMLTGERGEGGGEAEEGWGNKHVRRACRRPPAANEGEKERVENSCSLPQN